MAKWKVVLLVLTCSVVLGCRAENDATKSAVAWSSTSDVNATMKELYDRCWKKVQPNLCKVNGKVKLYAIYKEREDYDGALKRCRRKGGDLAKVESKQESEVLDCLMNETEAWVFKIGGRSTVKDDKTAFKWTDGSQITFDNWHQGEPSSNSGEFCLEKRLALQGTWNNIACSKQDMYACYFNGTCLIVTEDRSDSGRCLEATFQTAGTDLTFGKSLPGFSVSSEQLCPKNGVPVGWIRCPETGPPYSYQPHDLVLIECSNRSFGDAVDEEDISLPAERSEVLLLASAHTAHVDKVSQSDMQIAVDLIHRIVADEEIKELSDFSYRHVVDITDHVTRFVSSRLDANLSTVELTKDLVDLAFKVDPSTSSFEMSTPTSVVEIYDVSSLNGIEFRPIVHGENGSVNEPVSVNLSNLISLGSPRTKLERAVFAFQKGSYLFQSKDEIDQVISVEVGQRDKPIAQSNLSAPIQIEFATMIMESKYAYKCVYWDYVTESWSGEGCWLAQHTDHPTCLCDHLTNFGILVNINKTPESFELKIVTYVGCGLSIASLVLISFLIIFEEKLRRRTPMKILVNVCLNLTVTYILFIAGGEMRPNMNACIVSATLLHYFLLTSWCWMALYMHHLYQCIVRIMYLLSENYYKYALAVGYLFPALVVGTNIGITKVYGENNGSTFPVSLLNREICWLRGYNLYFAFLLPMMLLHVFNTIVFLIIVRRLTCARRKIQSSRRPPSNADHVMTAVTISSVSGLVWIFGYFMLISRDETYVKAFSWVFSMLASTQGFSIFLVTIARDGDVRKIYLDKIFKSRSKENKRAIELREICTVNNFAREFSSSIRR